MTPLTSEHFDEAERLGQAATPAPWDAPDRQGYFGDTLIALEDAYEGWQDDVAFIAFMRNHGPDAFRELKAARERIAELEAKK